MEKPENEKQEKDFEQQKIITNKVVKFLEELTDEGIIPSVGIHSIFLNLGIVLSRVMSDQEFNDLISFIKSRGKK